MSTTGAPASHSPPMAATQAAEGPPESAGPVVSARDVTAAYRASTVWAGATFDVSAPATGKLAEQRAFPDDRIEPGQVLGIVEVEEGEA